MEYHYGRYMLSTAVTWTLSTRFIRNLFSSFRDDTCWQADVYKRCVSVLSQHTLCNVRMIRVCASSCQGTLEHTDTGSRDGVVGMETRLRTRKPGNRISIPGRIRYFPLLRNVQTNPCVHPASCLVGTGESFLGDEAVVVWNWPLTSIYSRFKKWVELYLHFPINCRGVQSKNIIFSFAYGNCLPVGVLICIKFLSRYSLFIVNLGYDGKCNYTDDSALPSSTY
jgi:hypothetical protein